MLLYLWAWGPTFLRKSIQDICSIHTHSPYHMPSGCNWWRPVLLLSTAAALMPFTGCDSLPG